MGELIGPFLEQPALALEDGEHHIWMKPKANRFYVHENCAAFSPEVTLDDQGNW